MSFICNDNLKIAYDRSDEIIQSLVYEPDRMIDTALVLEHVQRVYCPVIEVFTMSFANVQSEGIPMQDCGAMMQIDFDTKLKAVSIVLNSDMPLAFQRFSLMQQIGHLVTLPADAQLNPDNFHVSTHINYDLSAITEEDLTNNYYLLREQIGNIFALRVLMPSEQFFRVVRELGNIQSVATFFGVPEDAVISRMMIGA